MSRATQRSTSSRPFSSTLAQLMFRLRPKQGVALFSTATEILCGGAAGEGARILHLYGRLGAVGHQIDPELTLGRDKEHFARCSSILVDNDHVLVSMCFQ